MLKNRFYNMIVFMAALIIIFDIGYIMTINKYKKVQGSASQTSQYNKYPTDFEKSVLNGNLGEVVTASDTKLIFIMKNNRTDWTYTAEEKDIPKELIGMKSSEIQDLYSDKGYKLQSITPQKVTFLKEVDGYNYSNNKYVLGVYDEYIAIYKIDNNGKIYIEDKVGDISKVRKVKDFPQDFRDMLLKGSSELQFDNKQVARDYLNGCIS